MKHKLLSFLILTMMICSFSMGAAAADAPKPWDGSIDTSWYNGETTTFNLDTAEKLAGLAAIINDEVKGIKAEDFSGKTINITADLDLGGKQNQDGTWDEKAGKTWTAIGYDMTEFCGTLDGKMHKITNLYIETDKGYQGFIGSLGGLGVIKNVKIESGYIHSTRGFGSLGAIVSTVNSKQAAIYNCTNKANVTGVTSGGAGGIAGVSSGTMQNCQNYGNIENKGDVGGIVGKQAGSGCIGSCVNNGNISTLTKNAGGIVGNLTSGYIGNCYNVGAISAQAPQGAYVGGISGNSLSDKSSLINCYNIGNVSGNGTVKFVGSVSGSPNIAVLNCYYLAKDDLCGVGNNESGMEVNGIAKKTEAELKDLATGLGSYFSADKSVNINSGYPILKWQQTDKYEIINEKDALDITGALSNLTSCGFTVSLNKLLTFSGVTPKDFTLTAVVNGENAEIKNLAITAMPTDGGTVLNFSFKALPAEKETTYTVKYNGGSENPITATFVSGPSNQWIDYAAKGYESGDGSEKNPWEIKTKEQLSLFSATADTYQRKFFILTSDLDISGKQWQPKKFNGHFDGKNHKITGVTVNSDKSNLGFFSEVNKQWGVSPSDIVVSYILNLHLVNPAVTGTSGGGNVGALAGNVQNTHIKNCSVTGGSITGNANAAGLIGNVDSEENIAKLMVDSCFANTNVKGKSAVGGLIAMIDHGNTNYGTPMITNSWSGGTVTLETQYPSDKTGFVGGLVGSVQRAKGVVLQNCYSVAQVKSDGLYLGGLVGRCWAKGNYNQFIGADGLKMENTVALNPSVFATATKDVVAARLIANAPELLTENKGKFINNYGLDVMKVNGNFAPENEANGKNVMGSAAHTKWFWEKEVGFDFSENGAWQWQDGLYPQLKTKLWDSAMYFTLQPIDATAYRTKAAVLGVEVNGGMLNYTYKWESSTNGTNWQEVQNATTATLSVAYAQGYKDKTQFRCIVTDVCGKSLTSNPVKVTLLAAKYTPEDATKNLVSYYKNRGTLNQPREAFSLFTMNKDFTDITINVPSYPKYFAPEFSSNVTGYYPWAFMDSYALGIDPHNYTVTGNGSPESMDIIKNTLLLQKDDGSFTLENNPLYIVATDIPVLTTAMEMYFDGKPWGNEKEGTDLGRKGAIKYIFSQLKNHNSGGQVYGTLLDTEKNYPSWQFINDQRSQCEFVLLMARLGNDPVYGEKAKKSMDAVLKTMEYFNDTDAMIYTESSARYVSALIGASEVTDSYFKRTGYLNLAAKIVNEKLLNSQALDGGYGEKIGENPVRGNPDATAAVIMALGDYTNEKASLVNYKYSLSNENIVANDLAAISIPNPVIGDLTLTTKGTNGSTLKWATSNAGAISTTGKVTRTQEDVMVTLTLTATKGNSTQNKVFNTVVKANADSGADSLDAAISSVTLPTETTKDITLGTSDIKDITFGWTSANESVISNSGKVTRPMKGSGDTSIKMTLTAKLGDLTKTKSFDVLVYAATDDSLKEGYYLTRTKYTNKETLNGYWDIWAAYTALGDDALKNRNLVLAKPASDWYGTQYGATVMTICLIGENPYNYKGVNYVKALKDNYGGAWGGNIYSELGMEAAGANSSYYTPSADAGINGTSENNMSLGIDISGWAGVILAGHPNEDGVEKAISDYLAYLKKLGISESGNFNNSNCISTGCALVSFGAFLHNGVLGADITDGSWNNITSGKNPIDAIYNEGLLQNKYPGHTNQMEMALCGFYNAKYKNINNIWLSSGVSKAKLETQIAKANELLANEAQYEPKDIATLQTALKTVNSMSAERLNAKIPDFGAEYYGLYDAVRFTKLIGQNQVDAAAAKVVSEQINALPRAFDITLANKNEVKAAIAAYDGLTKDQKILVNAETLKKLTDAEAKILALEKNNLDKETAKTLSNKINDLPSVKDLTLDNKPTVAAVRAEYDGLTKEQKDLISAETLKKLTDAEAKILALENAPTDVDIKNMTDVKAEDWFYGDVAYVLAKSICKGTSATTFGSLETMTRAQFVTTLGRFAKVADASSTYPTKTIFTDVNSTYYYATHVKWAVDNGITNGVSQNLFAPDSYISRQDMATMILRFAKVMNIQLPQGYATISAVNVSIFNDNSEIAEYANKAVYTLQAAGVIKGKENNTFDPQGKSLRSEVAAVLHRFLTMDQEKPQVDTVTISMEKFTLGQGYVIEPTIVPLEKGDTAASVLERLAKEKGIETNANSESMGYYLKSVKDKDVSQAVIPQYILNEIAKDTNVKLTGRSSENWLGEFDYTCYSGWIYWVNNQAPEVTASNTTLKNGDVMRWQYSLMGQGSDLGKGRGNEVPYIITANKDALTTAVAQCTGDKKASQGYADAISALKNLESTQEAVDNALNKLK
ncbi:MAG: S-layer homology domain-containing protein [Clostridiales bacterium]